MQVNYKPFIDRMINKYEGGYSNDVGDPGGPTRYGITYIDAAEHRHVPASTMYDRMRDYPLSEAEDIYDTKYAVKTRFNGLQSGVDTECLDYNVNSGVARAPLVLSRILGLSASKVMTTEIVAKANNADAAKLIDDISAERLRFMKAIKNGESWARFGRGWGARVDDLNKYSHNLAKNITAHPDIEDQKDPNGMGKATHIDPKPRKTVIKAGTGGTLGAGASHTVTHDALVTACIVGGVLVVTGFAYYQIVRHQNSLQNMVHI